MKRYLSLILLFLIFQGLSPAKPNSVVKEFVPVSKTEDLVEQIENESLPMEERLFALGQIGTKSSEYLKILRRLVSNKHEFISSLVIQSLLLAGDKQSEEIIRLRLFQLSIERQSEVLLAITKVVVWWKNPFHSKLARQTLMQPLQALKDSTTTRNDTKYSEVAGFAALILANNKSVNDNSLVRRALQEFPRTPSLWLSLVFLQGVTEQEIRLAESVYNTPKIKPELRIAVALALAPHNKQAKLFFVTKVNTFIAAHGNRNLPDLEQMLKVGDKDWIRLNEYLVGLEIISRLRFLFTPEAEQLVSRCLKAGNSDIRSAAALVAADRYPEKILALSSSSHSIFSNAEQTHLLAYISIQHPGHKQRVRLLLSNLDVVVAKIQRSDANYNLRSLEEFVGL